MDMNTEKNERLYLIDLLRGLSVISMIAYHAMWDAVHMYGWSCDWLSESAAHVWQQSICWTFIIIAGFCFCFDKHPLKRGMMISLCGVLVTVISLFFSEQDRIIFGILTLLGACILLMIPLQVLLNKIRAVPGIIGSLFLFFMTRNCEIRYLGFEKLNLIPLPAFLYQNILTAFLGFPGESFYSSDYFPLVPWFFLFLSGFYLQKLYASGAFILKHNQPHFEPISRIGKMALPIYLIHQPLLILVFELVN